MRRNAMIVLSGLLVALVICLAGCGNNGGSASVPAKTPTKATLKLSINNLPVGIKVGALRINFSLPAGVVPFSLTGNDASGSIVFSGNASGIPSSLSIASYVPPIVTIGIISIGGLVGGEFMTINCTINPGTSVLLADVTAQATIDTANDTSSTSLPIVGFTVPIAVTLQ